MKNLKLDCFMAFSNIVLSYPHAVGLELKILINIFRLEYARCYLLLCDFFNYNWFRGSDPAQRAPNNPSDARQKRIGLPLRTHQPCAFQ